jgi:hypothetical protein
LDPPRDGDRSAGDDGMIAEVIPLRRRTRDGARTPREAGSSHSGAFNPPPDPEPLSEYSVWDRPTAELIRRERPDELMPVRRERGVGATIVAHGRPAAAVAAALVAICGAILALLVGQHHATQYAGRQLGSAETGLGTPLGGAASSTSHVRAQRSTRPASKKRASSATRHSHRIQPVAPASSATPASAGGSAPSSESETVTSHSTE